MKSKTKITGSDKRCEWVIRPTANWQELVTLSAAIPEFSQPYPLATYQQRLANRPVLALVAYEDDVAVGFKVGYAEDTTTFYSWMGGVLPVFRRQGVAQALATAQETWARAQGYRYLTCKTRNQHRAMLIFALCNDFHIVGVTEKPDPLTNRIWLRKVL